MYLLSIFSFLCLAPGLEAQSIADKKASLKNTETGFDRDTERLLFQVNKETEEIEAKIRILYEEVLASYEREDHEDQYKSLLDEINENKRQLALIENTWREVSSAGNRTEQYGLWHAPETTLEQLIIDYGSQDYVYLIPPEIGGIKLSIDSNLAIPRSSWGEMLQLILKQTGVGIKVLNPYLRQLYLVKQNNSNLRMITNNSADLEVLPQDVRVSFVLSPEPSEVRRVYLFLEKFIDPNTTTLQVLGRDILIIGPVGDVQGLLKLYDFIATNRGDKEYRLVPVFKVKAEEMAKILNSIFDRTLEQVAPSTRRESVSPGTQPEANGLKIIVLENMIQGLFLVGTKEELKKAEEIVRNVESQVGGAHDKVVYWYSIKHSDPEELADVLYRVYNLMIVTGTGMDSPNENGPGRDLPNDGRMPPPFPPPQRDPPPSLYGQDGFYQEGGYVVNPAPAQPGVIAPEQANANRDNFIVDIKTGSIVMVVEADILPKLKDLLRKLDVPKKMVQIETLLFEKILNRENNFGLNLLKIGEKASQSHLTGAWFNNIFYDGKEIPGARGVFDFFLSREKTSTGIPAFDLSYRFLLSQDDIQINSSPSILTLNQTPATFSMTEDISINTGVFEVGTGNGGVALKDAFTRAQYGITIGIKPTIHMQTEEDRESGEGYDYVTLDTDVTFDTIQPGHSDRPNVTRRHIKNLVQIADGETVILGGLRRRVTHDNGEKLPFFGDIPGFGKLFGTTGMKDSSSEMFIFITPRIVLDPKEQLNQMRQDLLSRRPGDIPYFLACLEEAHRYEKNRLLQGTITMLMGRSPARYYIQDGSLDCQCEESTLGEYEGR